MPADKGSDEYNTWNVGIINERESWLYSEESWNDYANDDLGIRVKEEEDETEMAMTISRSKASALLTKRT